MNIKILQLILKNFKGTKSLTADFKGENVAIKGDNGTGKSTIVDAFNWILFDKNSAGVKTFNIKTLDKDNNVIHNLDHEATAVLLVDEKEITLKKLYKETWTKKRGEAEKGLTGHTTDYFVNEVPFKKGDYDKYIHELVDEKIFKLITSPLEFNNLPWKERRTALLEIVGDVSDENVITSSAKLKKLGDLLNDRSVEDFKKVVSSKKKLLNSEIETIPIRVDELVSSVDITGNDFTQKENEIKVLENEVTRVDFSIADQSGVYKENNEINSKIYKLKNQLMGIENIEKNKASNPKYELQKQINDMDTTISNKKSRISSNKRDIERNNNRLSEIETELVKMRNSYTESVQHQILFDQDNFECPTCKREYDKSKADGIRQGMIENFEDSKKKYLSGLSAKGAKLNTEKNEQTEILQKYNMENEILDAELKDNVIKFDALQVKVNSISVYEFVKTPEYLTLEKEITTLEASIKEPNTEYLDSLKLSKKTKEKEIDSLKAEINQKVQFEKNQVRIQELEDRKTELGIMIADLEGQEFLCETFIKTKVDMLEDKINSKFKNVNFRLFETQINEGLKECCDVLVNGVPYSDVNTGGRINAGLDVINTLCDHYNVYAPIFIDGRESITKIIDIKSQVINLVVVKGAKLTIEGAE